MYILAYLSFLFIVTAILAVIVYIAVTDTNIMTHYDSLT